MNYQRKEENNHIYNCNKTIRYLGINLTKQVKHLYLQNYKILKKNLRKIQIRVSIYCVHGLEELIPSKYPHYPKKLIDSIQLQFKCQ